MDDQLPDLKADYILANPPFNISDWGQEHLQVDPRWKYGLPPKGNANFAWIQHMIHHLSPYGTAGFVLANGSMSSQTGGEGDIRKQLVGWRYRHAAEPTVFQRSHTVLLVVCVA